MAWYTTPQSNDVIDHIGTLVITSTTPEYTHISANSDGKDVVVYLPSDNIGKSLTITSDVDYLIYLPIGVIVTSRYNKSWGPLIIGGTEVGIKRNKNPKTITFEDPYNPVIEANSETKLIQHSATIWGMITTSTLLL